MNKQYWLMKSEPSVFSLADLARIDQTGWEGVRNYQARNMMRDLMQIGDEVLFYHSSTDLPGVAGLARVSRTAYPDPTQFDPHSPYYAPKATATQPIWMMVDLQYVATFSHFVSLAELRQQSELEGMLVLKKGQRLSIQSVTPAHFQRVVQLGR